MLEKQLDSNIGEIHVKGEYGNLTLSQFLADPRSRAQGLIVVHKGRIVFEQYPGMREFDSHVWMSVTKTAAALVIDQLVEEGKIDVRKPVDTYLPDLRGSAWAGVSVMDVLDMTAGLNNVESQAARLDPRSIIARHNFAANGVPNADGKTERAIDVILACKREKTPGQAFDYSSVNTVVLGLLAEAVEHKRWVDIFHQRVWSKMTVEGDALMNVASDGVAHVEGMLITRLRDAARYGMLYTPSWHKAARQQVVSARYIDRIQHQGRNEIYLKGELGRRMVERYFPASPPVANSWQWDAVFADGDFYKSGTLGQGLYVSPDKDLVVVWFSTILFTDLTQYARAIAQSYPK
jgi:CubicO group peptidase (beta-lactamase class C family)